MLSLCDNIVNIHDKKGGIFLKRATKKIVEYFPCLKNSIPNSESVILEQRTLDKLNDTEQVFLKMIWFFEQPHENNFNLYDLLEYVDGDWLSFALECIFVYFSEDTYLIKRPTFSVVTEDKVYLNQNGFTNFLNVHKDKHNKNFSRPMLNTYLKRGLIPKPDLTVADTKYWLKETCEEYLYSISVD